MSVLLDIREYQKRREKRLAERNAKTQKCRADAAGANTRLPYGLCKSAGIDTEGMSPKEAWDALTKKTGIKPEDAYKMLGEGGSKEDLSKEAESDTMVIPAAPTVTGTKIPVKTGGKIEIQKLKTVVNAQKTRNAWAEQHKEYEPYAEKVSAGMKYLFDDNEFCINFQADILDGIIAKGFMNQLQTAAEADVEVKTHGDFSPDIRRQASHNMFGTPKGAEAADYEKYGYLGNPFRESTAERRYANQYGDTIAVLKKDRLKNRVTYSLKDSLDRGFNGLSVPGKDGDDPSWEGIDWHGLEAVQGKDGTAYKPSVIMQRVMNAPDRKSRLEDITSASAYGYLELQYHGELTISDVDTLVFTSISAYKKITPEALEVLDKLGVKILKQWQMFDDE